MKDQRGSALIITILIVAILAALVVEFAYEVYIDTAALSNWSNAQKASLMAKSGQALSSKYINMINSDNTRSELLFPVENDLGPDTQLTLKIEDENAKLNINSILKPNLKGETPNLTTLKKLFEYLNINPELALVIADWIDDNSEPRLPDSEDNVKNSDLLSIDELKRVPGVTKEVFDKIKPYVTVFGNSKININTAQLPLLSALSDNMTELLAKRIIDYRESTPFEKDSDLQKVSGMEKAGLLLIGRIAATSSNFRVTSNATVNEITRTIESVVDTSMRIQFWREG